MSGSISLRGVRTAVLGTIAAASLTWGMGRAPALADAPLKLCGSPLSAPLAIDQGTASNNDPMIAVALASNVVEHFDTGPDDEPYPALICHHYTKLVDVAFWDSLIVLAGARRIDVLYDPSSNVEPRPVRTILPKLGPGDRIETVAAVNDAIYVVTSTGGDPEKPRFLEYDSVEAGPYRLTRQFSSPDVRGAVTAFIPIADGLTSGMFAYDDTGEVVVLPYDAKGDDVKCLRTIAGPRTQLRPALKGVHGRRPMTVDGEGHLIVGDDNYVFTFDGEAKGDVAPLDELYFPGRLVDGLAGDARAFLYVLFSGDGSPGSPPQIEQFLRVEDRLAKSADRDPIRNFSIGKSNRSLVAR